MSGRLSHRPRERVPGRRWSWPKQSGLAGAFLNLCLALGLLTAVSLAQADTETSPAEPHTAESAASAFTLALQAPADLRAWLLRHLELQRYQNLQDLDDTEMRRLVQDAQTQARELLATQGHFSPGVEVSLKATGQTAPAWHVEFKVDPGPRTRVASVELQLEGDILAQPLSRAQREQLQHAWQLPVGRAFSQTDWDRAKAQALRLLGNENYPRARLLESQAQVDRAQHQVHLRVVLDSGPLVRLGPVEVTGAERYDAAQVLRLAQLREGAAYRQSDLLEAQQRLVASAYYDAVFVSLAPDGPPEATPVLIELREAPRQKWLLGLGVRSESGPRLSAEYIHHRVPLLDWRATVKTAVDRVHQTLGLDLLAPPDKNLWRRTGALQLERTVYDAYTLHTQRLRAGRLQLSERLDRSLYAQFDSAQRYGALQDRDESLSVHYAFTARRFNSLPFPDSGWGFGVELGAGVSLGTQPEPYGRWLAKALMLQPLALGSSRLALRAEVGGVVTRSAGDLPSSQLFLAGGDQSVRGYAPGSIGVEVSPGVVVAGRYLASGSVEWQWPIRLQGRSGEWEGVLFADAGAVANVPSDLKARTAVGVGTRWRSPVGPLQIDLARAIDAQRWRLHLGVGFRF